MKIVRYHGRTRRLRAPRGCYARKERIFFRAIIAMIKSEGESLRGLMNTLATMGVPCRRKQYDHFTP
jgi:hypothetical protein